MDIDSLQTRAESGDIDSCLQLGCYIYGQKYGKVTAESMNESVIWFERAGNMGSIKGLTMVIPIKQMQAHAVTQITGFSTLSDVDNWREVAFWAEKQLKLTINKPELKKEYEEALSALNHARYMEGIFLCFHNRDSEVIELFPNDSDDDKINVLRGEALPIGDEISNHDIDYILSLLQPIKSSSYYSSLGSAFVEQKLVVLAVGRYSGLQRLAKNNYEEALSALKFARDHLTYQSCIDFLNDEFSRYKKRLFGGYKYA